VLTSTSAGPDVSVGGYLCLARFVGLPFHWLSLIYRSSMFAFSSGRLLLLLLVIFYIYSQDCFCPFQNVRAPKLGSHFTYVPVLALIVSRTLDFRESKCLFRGPEIWESTTTNNHGNLDTNLIIIFIFMLFCPN